MIVLNNYMLSSIKKMPASFWIIVLVVVFNVAQFGIIDKQNIPAYKALYSYDTADIINISMDSATVRSHWLSSITLANVAPESYVFIPNDYLLEDERYVSWLHSFGKVASVQFVDIRSSKILQDFNPSMYVVASGESMLKGDPYFAIAMKDNGGPLVNSEIAGLSTTANLPIKHGTSFILLKWAGPLKPFHPNKQSNNAPYYLLILELSLLSEEIQSRIVR